MTRFVKYAIALLLAALVLSVAYVHPAAAQDAAMSDAAAQNAAVSDAAAQNAAVSDAAAQNALVTAEQLYLRGEYMLAAQAYQQVVDRGYADSALFYNMGLAYRQAGDMGRALWSLKSAQAIDPRDPDIEAALAQVRSQIATGGAVPAGQPDAMAQVADLAGRLSTLNELAWLGLALWFVLSALLLVFILRSRSRALRRLAAITAPLTAVLLFVVMLAVGSRMVVYHSAKDAVVVARNVDVTNGPGPQYGVQFALPGGTEVDILETRGNWVRIMETGNRASGWAPVDAVATVQPSGRG